MKETTVTLVENTALAGKAGWHPSGLSGVLVGVFSRGDGTEPID